MELYLIRHAESANNAMPTYRRVEDPALTAVGRLQADRLAAWLETLSADVFITSPFRRTLETARPILGRVRWKLQIWDNVYERGGCFRGFDESTWSAAPGLGRSAIRRVIGVDEHRCDIDPSIEESGWFSGRERESDPQAAERAVEVCDRLIQESDKDAVVVLLIHADLKRLMLDHLVGDGVRVFELGNIRNTSITKLNFRDERWQLDYFNSVSHLPAKLITGNEH